MMQRGNIYFREKLKSYKVKKKIINSKLKNKDNKKFRKCDTKFKRIRISKISPPATLEA